MMRILFAVLVLGLILCCSGCTVVNLAPPEENDGFLQRELEKNFGTQENKEMALDEYGK